MATIRIPSPHRWSPADPFLYGLRVQLTGGDEVRIHGFGTFKTAQRAARTGRNPRTGESVQVPARRVVRFSPSTTLSATLKSAKGAARKKSTKK